METLATVDERSIAIKSIKLSEDAVKGLAPVQVEFMKEVVVDVNSSLDVAGKAIRSASANLYELKANLKHGNWTALLKSGVLNVSEKAASDLVSAYGKWLANDDSVSDFVLATMTPRSLAAMANATPAARNDVLSKIVAGTKISEAEVRRLISGTKPTKKGDGVNKMLEVAGATVIESVKGKAKSIKEIVALEEKCEKLEAENTLLKARIKELEAMTAKA